MHLGLVHTANHSTSTLRQHITLLVLSSPDDLEDDIKAECGKLGVVEKVRYFCSAFVVGVLAAQVARSYVETQHANSHMLLPAMKQA